MIFMIVKIINESLNHYVSESSYEAIIIQKNDIVLEIPSPPKDEVSSAAVNS